MDMYFTDEIVKVSVITDEWSAKTEVGSPIIPCLITDNNKLIIDGKGQEVLGEMLIQCNKSNIFNYGDKIKVKKRWGVVYPMDDKKFLVKKIELDGKFQQDYTGLFI